MAHEMKPSLFIGCATESLEIAYALQENLEFSAEVTVWTQGILDLTRTTLQSLLEMIGAFDFALFVFTPDDVAKIRDQAVRIARDNVVFELGIVRRTDYPACSRGLTVVFRDVVPIQATDGWIIG